MIELSTTSAQTISPGQAITFDNVVLKTGCAESHRNGSSVLTLKAKCAVYEVHFAANVSGTAAGPVQLSISLDGEPLTEATVISTVTTAADPNAVATATLVKTDCGCCSRLSIVNSGTSDVVVSAGANVFTKRVC